MGGGPGKPQAVTALDPETGRILWSRDPIAGIGWGAGSPVAVRLGGMDLVVTQGGQVFRASDGRPLAEKVGRGGAATCAVRGDTVFFLEEFGRRRLAAVRLAADGPDAVRAETLWNVAYFEGHIHHTDWTTAILASPLLHGGRLYAVMQMGRLMVYDPSDGRLVGEAAVLPPPEGRAAEAVCWPSPVLAGPHLFIAERSGRVAVVRPGDAPEVLALGRLEELRGSPVFTGDRMIVRTVEALLAIGPKETTNPE
jgi:outer membrane protein assembly factor BamB